MVKKGDIISSEVVAYSKSHAKSAEDVPDDSSNNLEYRWRKKTWKMRSRFRGPK